MRSILVAILFISSLVNIHAQTFSPDLSTWDKETLNKARLASYNPLCQKKSNDVVFYTNLARMDGTKFVETILRPYMEFYGDTSFSPYLQSLIDWLYTKQNQPPLRHNLGLAIMAKFYALDAGRRGIVGHDRFNQRFQLVLATRREVAENCSYGEENPLGVVIQLLVDEGIDNLGHRRNILSKSLKRIGVGFARHKRYGINCIQEFSR